MLLLASVTWPRVIATTPSGNLHYEAQCLSQRVSDTSWLASGEASSHQHVHCTNTMGVLPLVEKKAFSPG
jgi:hypothetical protein